MKRVKGQCKCIGFPLRRDFTWIELSHVVMQISQHQGAVSPTLQCLFGWLGFIRVVPRFFFCSSSTQIIVPCLINIAFFNNKLQHFFR
jgi:hypothetical protein